MSYAPEDSVDCLHYCLPGPVDIYNQLLFHHLYTREAPREQGGAEAGEESGA